MYLIFLLRKYIYLTLYSLRPILLFVNTDVSRHIFVVDTSLLAMSIMGQRE
jgi:hypothetical protein